MTLVVPRLGRGRWARRIERRLGLRPYRVHLDEVGTFVWRRCDGQTTVARLAGGLRDVFGERVEPTEPRLVDFLTHLLRGGYVSVGRDDGPGRPEPLPPSSER